MTSQTNPSTIGSTWDVVSDNVAIEDKRNVYKIFDNRFHPTFRKPDVWQRKEYPWIANLKVEEFYCFKEPDSGTAILGRSSRKRPFGTHDPATVSYPNGLVLVIRYNLINGTHFASKISHFQDIAQCISTMHDAGIVHGDIRLQYAASTSRTSSWWDIEVVSH
jgi:hypothetical protein